MASPFVKGRKVKLEVGYTYGTPVAVTAISQADPAALTAAAHGLDEGEVAYLDSVEGMDEVQGQAIRAEGVTADALNAPGVDSTDFAVFSSGELVPVLSWRSLSQSTDYELGGGAPTTQEVTTLQDSTQKVDQMLLAAETVSITMRSLTQDNEALALVRKTAKALKGLVFRITHPDGSQRVWYGEPSVPGESVGVGGVGTGTMQVAVKGGILYLPPVVEA